MAAQQMAESIPGMEPETNEQRLNRILYNLIGILDIIPAASEKIKLYYKAAQLIGLLKIIKKPYYNIRGHKMMLLNEAFKNKLNSKYIIFYIQYKGIEYIFNIENKYNKITVRKNFYSVYRNTTGERNRTKNVYLSAHVGGAYFIEHQLKFLYNNNETAENIAQGVIDHLNEEGATINGASLDGQGLEYISINENIKRGVAKKRNLKMELKRLLEIPEKELKETERNRINKIKEIINN
jgi:hypothetical protein